MPVFDSQPGQEAPSPTNDREALKGLIREELQAERARQTGGEKKQEPARAGGKEQKKEDAKKEEPGWSEVGKDLQLKATWNNGLVARTADDAFRVHLGGRLEWDNTWSTQNDNLLVGAAAGDRVQDGTLFRRARLRADGTAWEFVDFVAEVNFVTIQDISNVQNQDVQVGSVGLSDFWLGFHDVPLLGSVRLGHLKAPVGLERLTSSNAWYYMERSSLYDAFLGPNDYQDGLLVFNSYLDDRVTLAGCVSWVNKATIQSFGFGADDSKYAFSARATALPVYQAEGQVLVHVGAGFGHQGLVDHTFAVANRPLLRAGAGRNQTPNLLFTGQFFTPNGASLVDLEGAAVCGPFAVSAEYAVAHVADIFDSFDGTTFSGSRGDVTYQAAYVEAGYFLTPGDYRRYDRKTGTWARTVPQENSFLVRGADGCWVHGTGAVQVLARYTFLDLVSGTPVLTPQGGGARAGREHDVTLGVTWYLNPEVYVMVNYVWTRLDSVAPGASGNVQGVGCRFHVDF
jgi:phosphate-selective porin OprO/OprP